MKTFRKFLEEEEQHNSNNDDAEVTEDRVHFMVEAANKQGKNLHLGHLEDLVFLGGIKGLRSAISFLQSLRDMLAGHTKSGEKVSLTTKWDGAPALFCGINPDNGKFFVGSKGVFSGEAKLCYENKDIDLFYPEAQKAGLNKKLKTALEHLPDLGIKGVLQGDFLFTEDDLKTEFIDGERYVTFRPNTITYAVPYDSQLAKKILTAKMGIVFHTTYRGRPFASMTASFGADVSSLRHSRNVFYRDAEFTDVSGLVSFDETETRQVTAILKEAGILFRQLNAPITNKIATVTEYSQQIMTWNNASVRRGEPIQNIDRHIADFIKDLNDKLTKHALEAKKPDTRTKRAQERDVIIKFWRDKATLKNLKTSMEIFNLLTEAKLMIVRKLEMAEEKHKIGTFVRTEDGYKVIAPEGFVAIDHMSGNAIKLVDRLGFSFLNFTLAKDWIGKK